MSPTALMERETNRARALADAMAAEARAVVRESMQRGPNRLKAAIYVLDRLTPPSGPVDVEEIEIERRAVEQDRFFRSLR